MFDTDTFATKYIFSVNGLTNPSTMGAAGGFQLKVYNNTRPENLIEVESLAGGSITLTEGESKSCYRFKKKNLIIVL